MDPQLVDQDEKSDVNSAEPGPKASSILTLPLELVNDAVQSLQTTLDLSGIDLPAVKTGFIHYSTLLMVTYMYCFMGGFLFRLLEGWHELKAKCDIQQVRYSLIEDFWNQSAYMDFDEWKSFATDRLKTFESSVHKAHDDEVDTYSGTKVWSFDGALVYSITILTTIGYGHIVPSTVAGKALTMVYAIFGIPLLLMVLTDYGKLLTRVIKFYWSLAYTFYNTKSIRKLRNTKIAMVIRSSINIKQQGFAASTNNINNALKNPVENRDIHYKINNEFDIPVGMAVFLLMGYVMLGALMFKKWEGDWSYFEAVYFVFISISTIGFGDYVPQHPIFMMGTFLYLLFGLALSAMCINVIQEWMTKTFNEYSDKLSLCMIAKTTTSTANIHLQNISSATKDNITVKTKNE